jgi:hypothetical protein
METANKITCPNCGHQFNTDHALALEVENKLRAEYNGKFKGLQVQLLKEKEQKEQELKQNFELERKKTEAELKNKLLNDFEAQLKSSQDELEAKRKENTLLKSKELELLKKERALIEEKQEFELEMQKKIFAERKGIEEAAKRKSDEDNQLKFKEKDILVEQLMKQVDEMKKRAEQGSMQLQGEALELILEELLRATFPFDTISEVGKGVKGADVIQIIRNATGKECGTIIYESKRTRSFSNDWIDKLKADLRSQKSDIAVIVTEAMPKDMDKFGQKDGIWICTFAEVKSVAAVLRESLIRIADIKASQENRGDKMQFLYDFLTGNEFKQHIESIVESFSSMQTGLSKERMAMERMWSEREKQLNKVLVNMSSMYGSIKGIAGNAVADVKMLDIDNLYSEEK